MSELSVNLGPESLLPTVFPLAAENVLRYLQTFGQFSDDELALITSINEGVSSDGNPDSYLFSFGYNPLVADLTDNQQMAYRSGVCLGLSMVREASELGVNQVNIEPLSVQDDQVTSPFGLEADNNANSKFYDNPGLIAFQSLLISIWSSLDFMKAIETDQDLPVPANLVSLGILDTFSLYSDLLGENILDQDDLSSFIFDPEKHFEFPYDPHNENTLVEGSAFTAIDVSFELENGELGDGDSADYLTKKQPNSGYTLERHGSSVTRYWDNRVLPGDKLVKLHTFDSGYVIHPDKPSKIKMVGNKDTVRTFELEQGDIIVLGLGDSNEGIFLEFPFVVPQNVVSCNSGDEVDSPFDFKLMYIFRDDELFPLGSNYWLEEGDEAIIGESARSFADDRLRRSRLARISGGLMMASFAAGTAISFVENKTIFESPKKIASFGLVLLFHHMKSRLKSPNQKK